MGTTFRKYQPEQSFLLPPSPRDWLPEDHLSYFISETVDELDLSGFYAPYEGDGRRNRPFDPRMMVKILIYGYATGTFSSRKLARRVYEDVAVRVLSAGNFPAHRTMAEFRQRHLKEFKKLFGQVARIAAEAGLVKLGRVAVDGCKIKANASKHKAMSYSRMLEEEKRLEGEIAELLDRAQQVDKAEDELYGEENQGDELPEEFSAEKDRGGKAASGATAGRGGSEARPQARRRSQEPEDAPSSGSLDRPKTTLQTESRIMKSSGGFEQCYNTQAAVDEETQMIVATGVTNNAADNRQLLGMIDAVQENLEHPPEQVVADAGYKSEENFEGLEEREIDGYISLGREGRDPEPSENLPATLRMFKKLGTEAGQTVYRRRKVIAEPVFGWVKQVLGFRTFSLRGLEKVEGEWDLVCLALNLKRMNGRLPTC